MVTCFFGGVGSGKSTILAKIALRERKRGAYEHILSNFYIDGFEKIDFKDLGKYHYKNSLIILDELTIDADNRDFKNFQESIRDFFIYHRHTGCNIIYATQDWSSVDKKIRVLTERLYYVRSISVALPLLRKLFPITKATQILRTIDIEEYNHDIIYGYRFANLFERIFGRVSFLVFRPRYYKYFDSFSDPFVNRPSPMYIKWNE